MPCPRGYRQTSFALTDIDMRRLDHLLADLRIPKRSFIAQAVLSALEQSERALASHEEASPWTNLADPSTDLVPTVADDSPSTG